MWNKFETMVENTSVKLFSDSFDNNMTKLLVGLGAVVLVAQLVKM